MKHLARFSKILVCLLACAALGAPVIAQPAAPDVLGDITVVGAGELEQAIGDAIAVTADELQDGDAGGFFQSAPVTTAVFGLINALLIFLTTNGVKLSTMWLRGRKTLVFAGLLSALLSGAGTFFGPAGGAGLTERLVLSLGAALLSLGGAVGAHETLRNRDTKQRKPERKTKVSAGDLIDSPLGKMAKAGLVSLATGWGLPGAALLVEGLLSEHTLEQAERIINEMGRKRAATVDEAQAHVEGSQAERAIRVAPAPEGGAL